MKTRILPFSLIFLSLFIANGILTYAQTIDSTESLYSSKSKVQVTGATVRGSVVYDDTTRPVRYVMVTLVNTDDAKSQYNNEFTKTDENGEFILKNVKTGTYRLYVKSKGILNPDVYGSFKESDTKKQLIESLFQKVTVSGNGSFNYQFRVKRGGSISGIVRYADGEVAPNVKVEALRKVGDKFSAYPVSGLSDAGESRTDDRGYYRFAGLPEGQYIIRAIEPVSHKIEQKEYLRSSISSDGKEYLKTYFPSGATSKNATGIDVYFGQEQTSIVITIPKRELYTVSGRVVLKKTGEPLKNFEISFYKLDDSDEGLEYGNVLLDIGSLGFSSEEIPSEWTLQNLPKGKYRIVAKQVQPYLNESNSQPKYPDVEKEIEITDSDIENLLLKVQTSGSIKGTITDRDGKNLPRSVYLFANDERVDIDDSQYKENIPESQKQLSFEVNKLLAGKIRFQSFSDDYYIAQVFLGNNEFEDQILDLKDGENLEGVRLVIASDMGTVKGRVENMGNATEVGIYLIKKEPGSRENPRLSFGRLDKKTGTYEIKAAPGEYYIIVNDQSNDRRETPEKFIEKLRSLLINAPTVTVKPYETTQANLNIIK